MVLAFPNCFLGMASDFNLLPDVPEVEGEDVVLLAMAREPVLDDHALGLTAVGGTLDSFAPASLALRATSAASATVG